MRILFVCLGNICRSPTAEGVMRALAAERDLPIEVDSAGTGSWHVGAPPDPRSAQAAQARGIVLEGAARQVAPEDFTAFNMVLAMDSENLRNLEAMRPVDATAELALLRAYDPAGAGDLDVPDPYYGGESGFDDVVDLVDAACRGLLDQLRERGTV